MTIVLVLEMHESAVRVLWHPWNQNRRVLSPRFFASKTQKIASGYKKKISILRQNTSEAVFETEKRSDLGEGRTHDLEINSLTP